MDLVIDMLDAFQDVLLCDATSKGLYGGSSSGKTTAVQQYCLIQACNEDNEETLVLMETQTDVLVGMFYDMCDMLTDWGVDYIPHESSPTSIILPNGHCIWFSPIYKSKGPQSSEAFKKFNNVKRVVINEATALSWEDHLQLKNRMGRTKTAEIIYTWNPTDENHWLTKHFVEPYIEHRLPPGVAVCHTTHKDNPYLTPEKHQEYEDLVNIDQNYYRVYCLGLPGRLEGLIYVEGEKGNWEHQPFEEFPEEVQNSPPTSCGLDWGYSKDQTALVAHWDNGNRRYAHQLIYALNMTSSDIIMRINQLFKEWGWPRNLRFFCDPSRPDNIEELRRAGINAIGAVNDINYGIDVVKQKHLIISDQSRDLIREERSYIWAEKNGILTNKPVDKFNHALDAKRYSIASAHSIPRPTRLVVRPQMSYKSPYAGGAR
ncbi:MAG: Phage terminase large subunit [Methanomassiliicoccales archaeon PtaB.Bin215]|nr:MAG: Phage terminase large subunit [Methanomassiliicoccales archaeon PtaB.Bin215]